MPSPLDRPGLDDPPLREWVADAEDGDSLGLGEAHARALRELVTPVEYAPGMRKSDNEINEDEVGADMALAAAGPIVARTSATAVRTTQCGSDSAAMS